MSTELHPTNVSLEGLLQVLGKNLYSSPSVALRELVQNAHDGIVRRRVEAPTQPAPQITLDCDPTQRTLTIEDNGAGLTKEEIQSYLATIGNGYTRILRDGEKERTGAIGYFGLGFLSAYVVSERVEVWTTSYTDPETTWFFQSRDGQRFSLERSKTKLVGTKVVLHLKLDSEHLASPAVVSNLIKRFCPFLEVPISLEGADEPLNALQPPWRIPSDVPELRKMKLRQEFSETFEANFSPICSWTLPDNDLGVQGVFWVQDGSFYASSDGRAVNVFVNDMFITDDCRELLPSWAGFLGCVISTRNLTPTASREDILRDDVFHSIKDLVHNVVIQGLLEIKTSHPENWRRVTRRHNDALRGAAVSDGKLFDAICEDLTIATSLGELTAQGILRASTGTFFIKSDSSNTFETVLFRARQIPIVNGDRFGCDAFCLAYSQRFTAELVRLGTQASNRELFPTVEIGSEEADRIKEVLIGPEERLLVSSFDPLDIPFVFVTDEDARLKRQLDADEADRNIGAAALSLARLHTAKFDGEHIRNLIVNIENPLIKRIATGPMLSDQENHVIQAVRSYLLTASVDVTDSSIDLVGELSNFFSSMESLLEGAG